MDFCAPLIPLRCRREVEPPDVHYAPWLSAEARQKADDWLRKAAEPVPPDIQAAGVPRRPMARARLASLAAIAGALGGDLPAGVLDRLLSAETPKPEADPSLLRKLDEVDRTVHRRRRPRPDPTPPGGWPWRRK